MKKELVICIFIIALIIITNIIAQNNTKYSVSKMSERLEVVSQIVTDELNIQSENNKKNVKKLEKNNIKREIDNLENTWNELQEKLAYYIEHDELEKVETQIYAIKGFYEIEQYEEILPEAEKCSFILKHIEEKTKLSVKNIF